MNPKLPRAGTMNAAQRAVPAAPPHISVHCKAVKGTSAQAKLLPKAHRPPVAPPVRSAKPPAFTPPKPIQPKMATPFPVKRAPAPTAQVRVPIQLAKTRPLAPTRAVIQRMEEVSSSSSSSSSDVVVVMSSASDALLSFTKSDGAVIDISHDDMKEQLNGTYRKSGRTVGGSYISYCCYNKGELRPDETRSPERYCHQGYIEVNKTLRQQGISYVLAYAGAVYASTRLGYTRVGTNSVNQNSGPLAKALGFKAIGEIQILSATTVTQQAFAGMRKYGWRVTGGTLAPRLAMGSSSSSSSSYTDATPLLDDDAPKKSKWCCCFLTTAVCRWRGLPDDCEELTLLRRYRDTYLRNSETGVSAVEHYYEIAPSIATAINDDPDAKTIYHWIYEVIHRCIDAIKREDYDSVFEQYKQMVLDLEARYQKL